MHSKRCSGLRVQDTDEKVRRLTDQLEHDTRGRFLLLWTGDFHAAHCGRRQVVSMYCALLLYAVPAFCLSPKTTSDARLCISSSAASNAAAAACDKLGVVVCPGSARVYSFMIAQQRLMVLQLTTERCGVPVCLKRFAPSLQGWASLSLSITLCALQCHH